MVESSAVADTRAVTVVIDSGTMRALGVNENELIPMSLKIFAANSSEIKLLGDILILIKASGEDSRIKFSRQLAYIAEGCSGIYVSESACV